MMRKLTRNRARANRGYTMVELVVAITIAVFLLMGLFTVLQSTRQGSNEATGLAELEDEERLAMTILADQIQAGGSFPNPQNQDITGALPLDTGNYTIRGQVFYGTTVTAGSSETMMVRYQTAPSDTAINCNGGQNTGAANAVYVNNFQLTSNAQGVSQLGCAVGSDSVSAAAATTSVMGLVNGVVGLTFTYAVNVNGATALTPNTSIGPGSATSPDNNKCPADTYKSTANMSSDDWTNVCAVKVALTFTNPLYQPPGQAKPTPGQSATITFKRVIVVRGMSGMNMVTVTPPASATGGSSSGS